MLLKSDLYSFLVKCKQQEILQLIINFLFFNTNNRDRWRYIPISLSKQNKHPHFSSLKYGSAPAKQEDHGNGTHQTS